MIGVTVKKIVALCVVSLIGLASVAGAASAPHKVEQYQMRQHPFDFVPQAKRSVPAWAKCPELWNKLRDAGWLEKDVVKADQIVWRESRCISTAHNKQDPNTVAGVKGSLGLFQINLFSRYIPFEYPQHNLPNQHRAKIILVLFSNQK